MFIKLLNVNLIILLLMLFSGNIFSVEETESVVSSSQYKKAIFAGGCFWCMEAPFEKMAGVISVVSGYEGGSGLNPTYKNYANKGYIEAIEIIYDPLLLTYAQLLDIYWQQIDPTDSTGQFVDRGKQYSSAIFYLNDEQKAQAEMSKKKLARSGVFVEPIVTEIIAAINFYPVEEYHQDYYKKNSLSYKYYRFRSGRDSFLNKVWNKDNKKKFSKS